MDDKSRVVMGHAQQFQDDDEDDVPEDFFDDFSNNDFLAGLDVVDAWEDGPAGKQIERRQPVVPAEGSEKRSVSRERGFKTEPKDPEPETGPPRKPAKERLGEKVPDDVTTLNTKNEVGGKPTSNDVMNKKSNDYGISKNIDDPGNSMKIDEGKKIGGYIKDGERRPRRSKSGEFNGKSGRRSRSKNRRSPFDDKRKRSKDRRSRSRGKRSRSPFRRESSDSRRDPSKTKRDIQRDKAKCAKDKEAKIISEKLKVVETGLVPPGTEMDVDLEAAVEKLPRKRTRSRSPEPSRRSKYPEESPSPRMKRRYRSPSPPFRSRFYRRTPSPDHEPRARLDKRFSHRSNERSPSRKKPSFLEELDEKLSVQAAHDRLQQIKEKINGGPIPQPVKYTPRPVPCPNPVPITNHVPAFQPGVYDEQFFIGPANPEYIMPFTARPPPPLQIPPKFYNNAVMPIPAQMPQKSIETLFNDENISLSAFLSITARVPDESKPLDVQSKIKVITRCQEAVKIMTEYTKPSGRFYYKGTLKPQEKSIDFTNVSPMKRTMPVRLNFTKRAKAVEKKPTTPLGMLLYKLGLKQPAKIPDEVASKIRANLLNQTTQTDHFMCEECEAKKMVKSANTGVQTVNDSADFSCQVTEDSFLNTARSALKNIIKSQSLAALTPAQILSQLTGNKLAPAEKEVVKKLPGLMEVDVANSDGGFMHSQLSPALRASDFNRRTPIMNQLNQQLQGVYPNSNINNYDMFAPPFQQINNRPFQKPANQYRRF